MGEKKKIIKVKPQLLKGFRDYPPEEQYARERMIEKVCEVFRLMGFLPLQTASLEFAETLLGPHYSKDSLAELFGFTGPDEVAMALRYEFTLSLARYVASQPNLALPFRRYQYGNVWRVDKPGPGRFREFMQFDIDIVGSKNMLADAEIIAAMVTTFEHLGIENFKVRYSNRKILNGLVEWAGIPAETGPDVMRVIDKLEKQGKEAVLLELGPGRIDSSGDKVPGLNLKNDWIDKLDTFLEIALNPGNDPLDKVMEILGDIAGAGEGVAELRQIQSHLKNMAIDENRSIVDLTIVRGLGYYTGPVFETTLLDLPEYGSVFSGGRYDDLVQRFLNQPVPAVGSSIGIDRLLVALVALRKLKMEPSTSKVLVTVMDQERLPEYLAILRQLRRAGIASEIYCGDTKNLTRQVKYADKLGIPFAVIAGSDEFESGQVTVKNLAAGAKKADGTSDREAWLKAEGFQERIPRSGLIDYLKKHLR
ncbi:MAG: histidine--tRNA ligase [candidate division Zixibacteria bacterium]|nr:histidine--tRNA ligase [candidate division Zixibacteria bacterium]MDD5427568.1 histidine--tRNA ligase [candidate division Zixibacteria bacterium]